MIKRHLHLFAVVICLVAFSAFVIAQEAKVLTPELVESLRTVGSVRVSPDGEWIAYTLRLPRKADEKSGFSYNEIYVTSADGSKTKPFVTGKQSAGSLAWSPDGKYLTFVTRRDDGSQVYGLPLAGGEAVQLTKAKTGVSGYQWSPDGTMIAYMARDVKSDEAKKEKKAGKDWTVVERDYDYRRLWVHDVAKGEARAVTPAEYQVWSYNWSPDGKSAVILASKEATTDASYMLKKIYEVDIASGKRELLHDPTAKCGTPSWSPDGSMIAWNGGVDMSDASLGSVFVLNMADKSVKNLTGDAEYTAVSVQWLGNDALAVTATSYQDRILFTIAHDGSARKDIVGPGPIFGSPSFNADGTKFALSASTPMHPNELFVGDMSGKMTKLTDSNPWLAEYKLGKQEVIEWTAQDGLKVQGVLIYPVDYQEGTRYPLIVQPHGGPESADLNGWITYYSKWSQMLAGQGYFVLNPNYRASIGRGVTYAKADHKDLGGKETQDVVDGIDYLIERGLVDGDRVGSGGGSYGGYFSALAATKHSERYAAAIVFAGITNWFSFQGTTDISIENSHTHWNIPDWHLQGETMWKASPVAYIDRANTPTLIAHGERDLRVPLGQGQELFRTLTFKGVPVELVVYPRAGHGLGESQHRLDYAHRAIEWFNKYVKNKEVSKEKLD